MLCSEAVLVNHGIEEARAVTLKCRSWSCELCQPDRKRDLIALAKGGRPNVFITLTVNPASSTGPVERARGLVKAWRLIVKRAKARHGYKKIAYFCVFEATKKGEPHLHILSDVPWLDQKWLSRQMAELTDAPIVDIRKVRSPAHVAHYIAKYIGKAPQKFGTLKRYWYTRFWDADPFEPEPPAGNWSKNWIIKKTSLEALREAWEWQGWKCEVRGNILRGIGDVPLWGQPGSVNRA